MSASKNLDEVSDRVVHWLQESGLSVSFTQNVPDYFNITVSPPPQIPGPVLNVARPKADSPFYVIGMGVTIHPEHSSKLASAAKPEREGFLYTLKYEYLRMQVEFVFVPPQAEIPQHIQLLKPLFIDGLTQNALYETYIRVRNAGLYTIWSMMEKFGAVDQRRGLSSIV